jgi:hypothetical protein
VTADEIIDRLYGLPAAKFTSARDEAVRALRKEGRRAEAAQVKERRKPNGAAAAVNRLVRDRRGDVERFLAAADALRQVQVRGQGDLTSATRQEREALGRLVRAGGDQVRQSLQAAAVDEEAARQLLAGRLERELEPRGFGTLFSSAPRTPAGRQTRAPAPRPKKADDTVARARLRESERALVEAKARERDAQKSWKQAKTALARAEASVTQARAELAKLRG